MEKSRTSKETVGAYAVQCGRCSKWRLIPSREEYETIRESFIEDPWFCDKNPEVSCDDPGDIEYDTSRLWVIDKPNAPKTPPNTTRSLSLRKNLSRTDVTYVMPNGKRVRSTVEVEKFLETYPEYKDQFSCQTLVSRLQRYWRTWFPEIQQVAIRRGGRRLRNRTDPSSRSYKFVECVLYLFSLLVIIFWRTEE
ncbi:methyl-CpG-binding domain-containing protein 4-like [Iris pallida]|uniref:Methyl-CpG-binding domain-containing protein 4-like n=1 Tax=Iris pallida TaxID=29817 RepID=A0AAX6HDX0_IRIPA|nr:methyl-CpG-binding domain-containing protein 4-like [Iris pallida]